MYPESLERNEPYIFTHKEVFYGDFHLSKVRRRKNYNMDMHMHDFYEVCIISSGQCMHYINGSKCLVKKGDVFIVKSNTPHGYYGSDPFEIFVITLSDKYRAKHLSEFQSKSSFYTLFFAEPLMRGISTSQLFLSLTLNQLHEILPLLDESLRYTVPTTPFDALISNSLVNAILAILCRFYEENHPTDQNATSDAALLRTISMIHEKYYEKFTLEQLAKMAQLSRSSFIKRFNEICHMPPLEYINKLRLEAAEDMLVNTNAAILQIAEHTGFYDSAHFSKAFNAKNGMSPGQFRKNHSK